MSRGPGTRIVDEVDHGHPGRERIMKIRSTVAAWLASGNAPASLEVPNPAGDYADPTGYVPQPVIHVAREVDEQTGLDLTLSSEGWRVDSYAQRTETTTITE